MNAIDDTRQIFGAKIEALEAKIDGKLALIFQRLDAMPDRAEMHKAISDAVDPLRKLIIGTAFAATGTILSLMFGLRALNIDVLSNGFDIAQMIVQRQNEYEREHDKKYAEELRDSGKKYAEELRERDKKHDEEMQALRNMIIDNGNFLRKLRDELLQRQAPPHP
jgi:hypothetical protein